MVKTRAADRSRSEDDFQRAAAMAEAEAGRHRWFEMSPTEQARAIYDKLRKIDASRATAMPAKPVGPGRFRVAGQPTKRQIQSTPANPSTGASGATISRD